MNDPRLDVAMDALQKIVKVNDTDLAFECIDIAKPALQKIKSMRPRKCSECAKKRKARTR